MNIIDKILFKAKYKSTFPLDNKNRFTVGIRREDGHTDLILNNNILLEDISFVTRNFQAEHYAHDHLICAKVRNGAYYIFDIAGSCFTPKGLPIQNNHTHYSPLSDFMYGELNTKDQELIVKNVKGMYNIIVGLDNNTMSPEFSEVSPLNKHFERKVKPATRNYYIYVDKYARPTSHPFLYETREDNNGNKIQDVYGPNGEILQVLVNSKNERLSKKYNRIKHELPHDTTYVGYNTDNNEYTYIDSNGKEIMSTTNMFSNVAINDRAQRLQARRAFDRFNKDDEQSF